MTTATLYPKPPVMPDPDLPYGGSPSFRRFTVDEYHAMIRSGVLAEGEPIELLDGYLVYKMSRGPQHDSALQALNKRLVRLLPDAWNVRGQSAATMDESEPEPDFAVVRGDESLYHHRHPSPADIGLLIEVSDSSLARDTREKLRIYARDGIPVYWVVNIPDRRIEVYADPDPVADPPAYRSRTEYPPGTAVPVLLDGQTVGSVAVAEVIPPAEGTA